MLTYHLTRPVCRAGPLQEAPHMAVLCYKLNVLIVPHRSCGRKVSGSVLHGQTCIVPAKHCWSISSQWEPRQQIMPCINAQDLEKSIQFE